MIAGLTQREMRDSWSGLSFTSEWPVHRLKSHTLDVRESGKILSKSGLYLALEDVESWTGRFSDSGAIPPKESQTKVFRSGDVLFGKLRPYLAKVVRPATGGVCVGEFLVVRARRGNLSEKYLEHYLRSKPFIEVVDSGTFGAKMPRSNWKTLGLLPVPIPPLDEQEAIVRFLAYANQRIDRFVRSKRKLIALLEEQKQAIINEAVTRGLDPDAPLKPSGIPWLGDIPTHWDIAPLKTTSAIQTGVTLGKVYGEVARQEFPYMRVANVQAGYLNLTKVKKISVPASEAKRSTLRAGDVLMTEGGDIDKLGRATLWSDEVEGCLHQNHVFAIRPNLNLLKPEYLVTVLDTPYALSYFVRTAKQTTNLASTNKTTIGSFRVPLPPMVEQVEILSRLEGSLAPVLESLRVSEREIKLIEEYRTRLISDVVTGQLDVREAVIPDNLNENSTLDELLGENLAGVEQEPEFAEAEA